jgi:hypothetical protein
MTAHRVVVGKHIHPVIRHDMVLIAAQPMSGADVAATGGPTEVRWLNLAGRAS